MSPTLHQAWRHCCACNTLCSLPCRLKRGIHQGIFRGALADTAANQRFLKAFRFNQAVLKWTAAAVAGQQAERKLPLACCRVS